jgi:hypothetical protein
VTAVTYINPGTYGSGMAGAVLELVQRGVDHVTFLTTTGFPPGLFMLQATKQGYRPRYGLSTQDAVAVVKQDLPDPRGQLHQSLIVGWFPEADVSDYEAVANSQPAQSRCLRVLASQGLRPTDANSTGLLDFDCDAVWYLEAAMTRGGGITASALMAGVTALGSSYQPAATFAVDTSRRRDGVARVRLAGFIDACTCLRYISPPRGLR